MLTSCHRFSCSKSVDSCSSYHTHRFTTPSCSSYLSWSCHNFTHPINWTHCSLSTCPCTMEQFCYRTPNIRLGCSTTHCPNMVNDKRSSKQTITNITLYFLTFYNIIIALKRKSLLIWIFCQPHTNLKWKNKILLNGNKIKLN